MTHISHHKSDAMRCHNKVVNHDDRHGAPVIGVGRDYISITIRGDDGRTYRVFIDGKDFAEIEKRMEA